MAIHTRTLTNMVGNAEFSAGSGLSVDDHACYESYYEEMDGLDEQGRGVVVAKLRKRLS